MTIMIRRSMWTRTWRGEKEEELVGVEEDVRVGPDADHQDVRVGVEDVRVGVEEDVRVGPDAVHQDVLVGVECFLHGLLIVLHPV